MSQKRSTVFSKTQKYALCIFIENINGKEEEQKTVVPKRWLDKDNEILWWPRGVNVTNKKFSDPDDSWKQYTLVKVLVEGEESLCNDLLTQSSSSSASGNEDARKLKSKTTNIIEKVPDKPTKSVMCMWSTSYLDTTLQSFTIPLKFRFTLPIPLTEPREPCNFSE